MTPPNILWICTDQQRFDTLGCYGNSWVKTPNIDALAASGTIFEHAYCQNPLCTPSRASFLTGRYPRTAGARQNGQGISVNEKLVSRLLRDEAGYYCGLAGKLHLSPCDPTISRERERRIDDGYGEFHWSHHPDEDWPEADYNQWLRAQGVRYGRHSFEGNPYVETSMPEEHHQTTWCANVGVDFIQRQKDSEKPWLFSINMFDPHHPFDPPLEYLQPYLDKLDAIPLPNYVLGELENKPAFQTTDHGGAYGGQPWLYPYNKMNDRDHRLIRAAYWAMCDLIDVQVGRLIEALEATGQRENTLVVFMSDHGEMLGDHGIYLKGPHFYDPTIRVPLIFSWPGHVVAQKSPALVELVDLGPTLVEAAGLPRYEGMQGRSLWLLLAGVTPANHHRHSVYCEHYGTTHHAPDKHSAYATMIRTKKHKLTVFHGHEIGELYDMEEDPNETHNLWTNKDYKAVKLELIQQLCDRMAWTVDPLPLREGRY